MQIKSIQPGNSLTLTNDGQLEIFYIGVGSAFSATHFQTNFLIIKGNAHIMVDFGMTGPLALEKTAGLKATDIRIVLPTHSHADHVGGIECIGLMNRYVGQHILGQPKTKMVIVPEYQRILWDMTLRGGMEWNEKTSSTSQKLFFGDFFDTLSPRWKAYQPREIFEIDVQGIHLELFRTKHIPEQSANWEASFLSYGLFIDEKVFVSCDTRFDRELIELYADKSEVMFHDAQFFQGAVHASLDELKTLPRGIKEKMFLVHYGDNWPDQNITDFAGFTQQGIRYIF